MYAAFEDAKEYATILKKPFWVLLDLTRPGGEEIGVIKSGLKSHHDLIGKPGALLACKADEGKFRR